MQSQAMTPLQDYWSATTQAGDSTDGWIGGFGSGNVGVTPKANVNGHVWCVRGGMNADGY